MPKIAQFLILLLAAVCFLLGTANAPGRVNWIALGLLLWVVVPLVNAADGIHLDGRSRCVSGWYSAFAPHGYTSPTCGCAADPAV